MSDNDRPMKQLDLKILTAALMCSDERIYQHAFRVGEAKGLDPDLFPMYGILYDLGRKQHEPEASWLKEAEVLAGRIMTVLPRIVKLSEKTSAEPKPKVAEGVCPSCCGTGTTDENVKKYRKILYDNSTYGKLRNANSIYGKFAVAAATDNELLERSTLGRSLDRKVR